MTTAVMEFQVCLHGNDGRWIVRLGSTIYGSYLCKEEAICDAVEAARDAVTNGREAHVLLREGSNASRIL